MNALSPEGFALSVQQERAGRIMTHVARDFGITLVDILSHRRAAIVARPRHVAWRITRELTPLSLPQIGALYHKDNTTILSGLESLAAWMFKDHQLRARVERLTEECRPLVEIDPALHEIMTRAQQSLMELVAGALSVDPLRTHREMCRLLAAIAAEARPLAPGDATREAISQ